MPDGVFSSSRRSNRRERFLLIICVGSPVPGTPCPPAIARIPVQRNCDPEAGRFLLSRRIHKYHVDNDRLCRGRDLFFEFRKAALQVIHCTPLNSSLACCLPKIYQPWRSRFRPRTLGSFAIIFASIPGSHL